MMSFNKLNFFQFKWAILVLAVYYIGSGHCSGKSKSKPAAQAPPPKSPETINAEFDYQIDNIEDFLKVFPDALIITRPLRQTLTNLPLPFKQKYFELYEEIRRNGSQFEYANRTMAQHGSAQSWAAFYQLIPKTFDVTIHAWAQVLQVEKELEKVAQSLDRLFDLNEQTFWEIEELILQDLPQNNEQEKLRKLVQNLGNRLQDTLVNASSHILRDYPDSQEKIANFSIIQKLFFVLAFESEKKQRREADLHKLRKKSEQEMANDAIKKVEKMSF